MKDKLLAVLMVTIMCLIAFTVLAIMTGCKPEMPMRSDYDNIPCYLADRCITINAYMENNKTECADAITKCFRYTDYDKCEKADKPSDCWDKLGIRK